MKILCWILTAVGREGRIISIADTWARQCDKTLFAISGNSTPVIPSTTPVTWVRTPYAEQYSYLWPKVHYVWRRMQYDHPSYDWYVKADDDSYINVPLVRCMLAPRVARGLYAFGRLNRHDRYHKPWLSGGSGYIFSNAAMRRTGQALMSAPGNHACGLGLGGRQRLSLAEDLRVSQCAGMFGVLLVDLRRRLGISVRSPEKTPDLKTGGDEAMVLARMLNCQHNMTPGCCAAVPLGFHYCTRSEIRRYGKVLGASITPTGRRRGV